MALRRFRFRFGLRTVLFVVLCAGLVFGWYAYVDRTAKAQLAAVEFFRSHSTLVIESKSLLMIQDVPVTGPDGVTAHMKTPMISTTTPPKNGWMKRLLGDHIFLKYSVLQIQSTSKLKFEDLKLNIEKMPFLEAVFMYSPSYSDDEIANLQKRFPDIAFEIWNPTF